MPKESGLAATRSARGTIGSSPLHGGALFQFVRHSSSAVDAGGHGPLRRNTVLSQHQDFRAGIAGAAVIEREEPLSFGKLKPIMTSPQCSMRPGPTRELHEL